MNSNVSAASGCAALLLLLVLLLSGLVCLTSAQPLFTEASPLPGWSVRDSSTCTIVNSGTAANPVWVPLLIGGVLTATGSGLLGDVWIANSSTAGASGLWTRQSQTPPFPPRSSAGLINVPVGDAIPSGQVLVLIGGFGPTSLLNDIWSSFDLGKTWSFVNVSVNFTARIDFGLVVGTPYDFNRTNFLPFQSEYAFLFGGAGNNNALYNDVYYTAGLGTQPWLPYPGGPSAPWSKRSGFGYTTYNGGLRVVTAGGSTGGNNFLNDVWTWDYITWKQIFQTAPFVPLTIVNLLVTQSAPISQQTFYILGGAAINGATPVQTVYTTQNLANWTNLNRPVAQPNRTRACAVINPTNNVAFYFGGYTPTQSELNDIWYGLL